MKRTPSIRPIQETAKEQALRYVWVENSMEDSRDDYPPDVWGALKGAEEDIRFLFKIIDDLRKS